MRIGYKTYTMDQIFKYGYGFQTLGKSEVLIQINKNDYMSLKGFDLFFHMINPKMKETKKYTLNYIPDKIVYLDEEYQEENIKKKL